MVKPCERCTFLRAEMYSACVEANAILQDRTERARFAESPRINSIPLFKEAKKRWDAAVSEFEAHHASHSSKPTAGREAA